jgi:hypothetical protein
VCRASDGNVWLTWAILRLEIRGGVVSTAPHDLKSAYARWWCNMSCHANYSSKGPHREVRRRFGKIKLTSIGQYSSLTPLYCIALHSA